MKESLNGFLSKSKSSRVVFGMRSIRKFNKISGRSLLIATIVVHDIYIYIYIFFFNALDMIILKQKMTGLIFQMA